MKNKMAWLAGTLEISDWLITSKRRNHGVDEKSQEKGTMNTEIQNKVRIKFFDVTNSLPLLIRCPAVAIMLNGILLLICKLFGVDISNYKMLVFNAIVYYSSCALIHRLSNINTMHQHFISYFDWQ